MRYFAAPPDDYDAARAALDAAYGYPDAETQTAIPPKENLPLDSHGRVCVSVDNVLTYLPAASGILGAAISAGVVEEIDEATFCAVCAAYYQQG